MMMTLDDGVVQVSMQRHHARKLLQSRDVRESRCATCLCMCVCVVCERESVCV
jgi:hypothetical protein